LASVDVSVTRRLLRMVAVYGIIVADTIYMVLWMICTFTVTPRAT
jgi:hypothetical protein